MPVIVLVAMDNQRGIGLNNNLPWHLPEDLIRFKKQTTGHAIIMGRKTWESLPKAPLPNRLNIVLSKNPDALGLPVPTASTLAEGIKLSEGSGLSTTYIIGGSSVYKLAIETQLATHLIITQVSGTWPCDTYFPNPEPFYQLSHVEDQFVSQSINCTVECWTINPNHSKF